MSNDFELGAALDAVRNVVWPRQDHDVWIDRAPVPGGRVQSYLALPSVGRPRLLVPLATRQITRAAVAGSSVGSSRSARAARQALALGLGTGIGAVSPVARVHVSPHHVEDSLLAHCSLSAGMDVAAMSIRSGTQRLNQKPVLQLLDDKAGVVGFAKLGTNDLTRKLANHEHETLVSLAARSFATLRPPLSLSLAAWRGHATLLLEPLPIPAVHDTPTGLVIATMREVAGPTRHRSLLSRSAWIARIARGSTARSSQGHRRLQATLDRVVDAHGKATLEFGDWHGDFRPWNVAGDDRHLLVWDWERYGQGVPVGFDAAHWHHPLPIAGEQPPGWDARIRATRTQVADWLALLGVRPELGDLIMTLHLVELALRHLEDGAALNTDVDHAVGLLLDVAIARLDRTR